MVGETIIIRKSHLVGLYPFRFFNSAVVVATGSNLLGEYVFKSVGNELVLKGAEFKNDAKREGLQGCQSHH